MAHEGTNQQAANGRSTTTASSSEAVPNVVQPRRAGERGCQAAVTYNALSASSATERWHMVFPFQIDHPHALVTITYDDPVTFERWRATMREVFADPAYRPGFRFLGDRRGVRETPRVSYVESVVEFLESHAQRLEGGRWANLVPAGDRAMFGMGHMIDLMTESRVPLAVRTFDDHAAAMAWLNERGPDSPAA
jgi:hypothetical protein